MSRTVATVSVRELNLQSLQQERKTGWGDSMFPKVGQKRGLQHCCFSRKNKTFRYTTMIFQLFIFLRILVTANEFRKPLPIFNAENGGNRFLQKVGTSTERVTTSQEDDIPYSLTVPSKS